MNIPIELRYHIYDYIYGPPHLNYNKVVNNIQEMIRKIDNIMFWIIRHNIYEMNDWIKIVRINLYDEFVEKNLSKKLLKNLNNFSINKVYMKMYNNSDISNWKKNYFSNSYSWIIH